MHPTWRALLTPELEKPYFRSLIDLVLRERERHVVFPPREDVYRAFELPPEDIKVVILGQDPYHNRGQAHGLSFSVKPGYNRKPVIPASLMNIFKELKEDIGVLGPQDGCLAGWAQQGVMLLNTILTVREGLPASHHGWGWETFTDEVIRQLSRRERRIVFVLWGSHARAKRGLIDESRHAVIESAHPSPRSCHQGFFGSKPFSRANEALIESGQSPIDW